MTLVVSCMRNFEKEQFSSYLDTKESLISALTDMSNIEVWLTMTNF